MLVTEQKPNRLMNEKSPYLLQHARNPVDWYPWGDEAFTKAKAEDKPVFLSIGYSTCHWCHVMERESFEDEEVAQLLNAKFVSVKVDREERPDVDHIYMTVCQALTGAGGWPLTIIMTPDKKPFFAGTYFPKNGKWGRSGLLDILNTVHEQWAANRERLVESGEKITRAIQAKDEVHDNKELTTALFDVAYAQLEKGFDPRFGGFGMAPKFPTPHNMMFLLRYWRRTGEQKALAMVEKTLESMHRGGIYDHLGFGFARYSVDNHWLVPHFEKMLYDNALLCYTYLEAYQCSGNPDFARVAGEIIHYVLRDMTSPEGGFYSAEDADSEGEEGKFYAWTRQEVLAALGSEQGTLFAEFYGITPQGNFEHGTSILHNIGHTAKEFAAEHNLKVEELAQVLAEGREKLYKLREDRVHPFKDDKILTAWNALMIAALAKASRVLGNAEYSAAAEQAVEFIFKKLIREDGRLLARYRDGEAGHPAYLDDHAFMLWGLVELYEATFSTDYLDKALNIAAVMERLFSDEERGGFYFYGADSEALIVRPKELYDGAIPSGNSVAAFALLKLARIVNNDDLVGLAERALQAFSGEVARYPRAYAFYLLAAEYYLEPPLQVVIAGSRDNEAVREMLRILGTRFLPTTNALFNDTDNPRKIAAVLPHIVDEKPVGGEPTAYICRNFACQAPIRDLKQFEQSL